MVGICQSVIERLRGTQRCWYRILRGYEPTPLTPSHAEADLHMQGHNAGTPRQTDSSPLRVHLHLFLFGSVNVITPPHRDRMPYVYSVASIILLRRFN